MKYLILLSCVTLLFACTQEMPQELPQIPVALQDNNTNTSAIGSISKSRNSIDIIQELYEELINSDTALLQTDKNIQSTLNDKNEALNSIFLYSSKSNEYYQTAQQYALSIQDSLLRERLENIITNSETAYKQRSKNLDNWVQQIDTQHFDLKDYYVIYKTVLTLPLLEKYQQEQKPTEESLKNLLNNKKKSSSRLKNNQLKPNLLVSTKIRLGFNIIA